MNYMVRESTPVELIFVFLFFGKRLLNFVEKKSVVRTRNVWCRRKILIDKDVLRWDDTLNWQWYNLTSSDKEQIDLSIWRNESCSWSSVPNIFPELERSFEYLFPFYTHLESSRFFFQNHHRKWTPIIIFSFIKIRHFSGTREQERCQEKKSIQNQADQSSWLELISVVTCTWKLLANIRPCIRLLFLIWQWISYLTVHCNIIFSKRTSSSRVQCVTHSYNLVILCFLFIYFSFTLCSIPWSLKTTSCILCEQLQCNLLWGADNYVKGAVLPWFSIVLSRFFSDYPMLPLKLKWCGPEETEVFHYEISPSRRRTQKRKF